MQHSQPQQGSSRPSLGRVFRRLALGAAVAVAAVGSMAATSPAAADQPAAVTATPNGDTVAPDSVDKPLEIIPALPRYKHMKPTLSVPVGTTVSFTHTGGWFFDVEQAVLWTADDDGAGGGWGTFEHTFNKVGQTKVTVMLIGGPAGGEGVQMTWGYVTVTEKPSPDAPELNLTPAEDQVIKKGETITFRTRPETPPPVSTDARYSTADDDDILPQWTILRPRGGEYDGGIADREPLIYPFSESGVYHVSVLKRSASGAAASKTIKVTVLNEDGSRPPDPKMTPPGDQIVTVGDTMTFDGSGSKSADGGSLTFTWNVYPDHPWMTHAEPVPGSTFSYNFPKVGWFQVGMAIRDSRGQASGLRRLVWVRSKQVAPVAKIAPDGDQTVPVGTTLTFDGSASTDADSQGLSYEWYSDDSDKGVTEPKFTKTFDKEGKVKVTLLVMDGEGNMNERSVTITVGPKAPANRAPVAKFTGPSKVTAGVEVSFDGSGSSDPDGDALKYEWRVRGASDVVSRDKVLKYKFPKAGSYGVELTVTDPSGASAKQWMGVEATSSNRPPVAKFTVPSAIEAGKSVAFDGSGSSDPDGDALKYEWRVRYAKGVVGTAKVLDYKFPKAGLYGVELTVSDPSGASAKMWTEVKVTSTNRPPTANFTVPSSITAGQSARFDGSSSKDPDGDALKYEWYVRGASGVVNRTKVLDYKFPKAGSYGVQLVVTDPSGASAKKWVAVVVK